MDRLGDLVLTLPVSSAHPELEEATWWIPKGLGFVAQSAAPKPRFVEVPKDFTLKNFFSLYKSLRQERFDQVLLFHAPTWLYFLVFLAGIPLRAGRYSQWYSFLLLNRGLRQRRSRSEKSELLYNFELAEKTLHLPPRAPKALRLKPSEKYEGTLKAQGLSPGGYALIHPGMGGSALNWPTHKYRALILELLQRGETVVITGTGADSSYTDPLKDLRSQPGRGKVVWLVEKLTGPELLDVLAGASWVLAPSTGVVHLAASLGVPTYGIYSPVRAQSAVRWGPQGDKVHILEPKISCPASLACAGESCPEYFCMDQIEFSGPPAPEKNLS